MATSYYYGYLNLVLPNKEYANTGIVERIETYEDKQGILVPEKKLFIMVPTSCHLPVNLIDKSRILASAQVYNIWSIYFSVDYLKGISDNRRNSFRSSWSE